MRSTSLSCPSRSSGRQVWKAATTERYLQRHAALNGANIVIDSADNVWLIDFFHTRRPHALMDLIKLENALLYISTRLAGERELPSALALSRRLLEVEDLAAVRNALARAGCAARRSRADAGWGSRAMLAATREDA